MLPEKPTDWSFEAFIGHLKMVTHLLGHLVSGGTIFLVFVSICWAATMVMEALNAVVPFPAAALSYIKKCELYLIYGDSMLCAVFLMAGPIVSLLSISGASNETFARVGRGIQGRFSRRLSAVLGHHYGHSAHDNRICEPDRGVGAT